jgi:cold shock CspA family protein
MISPPRRFRVTDPIDEVILLPMVDDLLSGRVTSFRREQGFGVITLDDGRDVKFDASNCTMIPEEGAAVRLRVGPARWGGGEKALHVEPRGSSTLLVPVEPPSLDQQIATLQCEHLVGALSEHVMAELIASKFAGRAEDATLLGVIDAYYSREPARARNDGYLRSERPFCRASGDILARISSLLPGAAVPRELSWTPKLAPDEQRAVPLDSRPRYEAIGTLHVQLPDGRERHLEVESLDDIVLMVNAGLRADGDPRRMYPLDTEGDWHAYLVLTTDRAQRLASVLPLAVAPSLIE